ncbi:hypothetical protein DIPPA_14514 [Diplonema papillatum]|nr:hypothetical protein DIPPA_14514 [Diplonema papillatum]
MYTPRDRRPGEGSHVPGTMSNDEILRVMSRAGVKVGMPLRPSPTSPPPPPSLSHSFEAQTFQYLRPPTSAAYGALRKPQSNLNPYFSETVHQVPVVPQSRLPWQHIDAGPWYGAAQVNAASNTHVARRAGSGLIREGGAPPPSRHEQEYHQLLVDAASVGISNSGVVPPWRVPLDDNDDDADDFAPARPSLYPAPYPSGDRSPRPLPDGITPFTYEAERTAPAGVRTLSALVAHGNDLVLGSARQLSGCILERHSRLNQLFSNADASEYSAYSAGTSD